jgi:hypothetical protein
MLRHRAMALPQPASVPTRLLYSSRRWDEVIYRRELDRGRERGGVYVRLGFMF